MMRKIAEWVAGAGQETFRLVRDDESGLFVLERASSDALGDVRWDRAGSYYPGRRGCSEANLILCEGIVALAAPVDEGGSR